MKRVTFHAAALLSGLLLLGSVYLVVAQPGQFYVRDRPQHQYSFDSIYGRIRLIDLVWPSPTYPDSTSVPAMYTMFNLPIWPLLLLSAVLPAWWCWWFAKRRKRPERRGFPVSEKRPQ